MENVKGSVLTIYTCGARGIGKKPKRIVAEELRLGWKESELSLCVTGDKIKLICYTDYERNDDA